MKSMLRVAAGTTAMLAAMPFFSAPALAQPAAAEIDRIDRLVMADSDRLTAIFKDIHRNPELAFAETRTAGIVASELQALGFEVQTGIAETGVVGILRNGDGPVVMYRADMDANAVAEANDLPYKSTVRVTRDDGTEAPVAHMCGHDAHVTWMLGMARAMTQMKEAWSGTLVLVGQPAEEPITGAQAMIDAGMYETHGVPKPDYFIGIHTAPLPVGTVVSAPGPLMAGTDQVDILFKGIGGHGSMPQMTKDPVLMAALAVVEFQAIVSRTVTPQETAVLTVGSIQAGSDNNVIPATALLKANLRWYSEATRQQMLRGIKSVSEGLARTYGMPEDQMPDITMKGSSTPLVNDADLSARLGGTLSDVLGEDAVIQSFPPATGSEDVHLLLGPHTDVPFTLLVVGVADPAAYRQAVSEGKQFPFSAHNPNFMVDLKAIPEGTRVATISVFDLMRPEAP
jgi:amidohydrolase